MMPIILNYRIIYAIFLLLLLAVFASEVSSVSCSISQPELDALGALYNSAGGHQWKWKGTANWSFPADTTDPCSRQWQGVTCNFVGNGVCNVKDIRLNAMNLAGSLPRELGALTGLQELQLKLNHNLVGRIPSEISGLTRLNKMILLRNGISGTIPSEIGHLTDLTQLNLFRNKLTGKFSVFSSSSSNYLLYILVT
jgi:Leucine-rich repeat (LRR) protein